MNETLPIAGATITLVLGLLGLLMPCQVAQTIGIKPVGSLGISEVRATYGGVFCGLGLACLVFQTPEIFATVGIAWLAAAVARAGSIRFDRSRSRKNIAGLAVEAVTGLLLLAGLL